MTASDHLRLYLMTMLVCIRLISGKAIRAILMQDWMARLELIRQISRDRQGEMTVTCCSDSEVYHFVVVSRSKMHNLMTKTEVQRDYIEIWDPHDP